MSYILLSANVTVPKDPGFIVGPILMVMGFIIDGIFNFVSLFAHNQALGISVILMTVIVRTIILPFAFKSQQSMTKMQLLQPELDKIKAKYGDSKDPEIARKIQQEQSVLYQKNKVNPFMGCLPMLITLPVFFALNALFRNTYLYIGRIGDIYNGISGAMAGLLDGGSFESVFAGIARVHLTDKMWNEGFSVVTNGHVIVSNMNKLICLFTDAEWAALKAAADPSAWLPMQGLLDQKLAAESFLGLNMVSAAGLKWPGILIPILVAGTQALASWIMMKTNPNGMNQQQKTTNYMMIIIMPVMMFVFTISMSTGVGIYWIISSVYQAVQQYFLNRHYSRKITLHAEAPKVVKEIREKKKK